LLCTIVLVVPARRCAVMSTALSPDDHAKILKLLPPLLKAKDLTKTSLKEVRAELETQMGLDAKGLDPFRDAVKELTSAEIQRITALAEADGQGEEQQEPTDEPEEEVAEAEEAPPAKAKAAAKPSGKAASKAKGTKRAVSSSAPAPAAAKARREGAGEGSEGEGRPKRELGQMKVRQSTMMTRAEFMKAATTHTMEFAGQKIKMNPKSFSTGSVGFSASQKIKLDVGEIEGLQLQVCFNMMVVGSKEWKDK